MSYAALYAPEFPFADQRQPVLSDVISLMGLGRPQLGTNVRGSRGDSRGRWEGDTMVVETVGFNEGFWMDRGQLPHTDQLRLLEKFTRTSAASMRYELTVDDPGAYTAPFTGVSNLRWENGTELFEYICQQANQASTLMVGAGTEADRSSPIVP